MVRVHRLLLPTKVAINNERDLLASSGLVSWTCVVAAGPKWPAVQLLGAHAHGVASQIGLGGAINLHWGRRAPGRGRWRGAGVLRRSRDYRPRLRLDHQDSSARQIGADWHPGSRSQRPD